MNDNTKLPGHYFAPGTLAQQEINRLIVDAHMMASTLESTSASLTEAQARNVQLAAALEMVQGECGMLMGKVAEFEARDLALAPGIDAIALAAATDITAACFAGVPGARMTERVKELVAGAMRAVGGVAPAAPIDRDTALEEAAKLVDEEICSCCFDDDAARLAKHVAREIRRMKGLATLPKAPEPAQQGVPGKVFTVSSSDYDGASVEKVFASRESASGYALAENAKLGKKFPNQASFDVEEFEVRP